MIIKCKCQHEAQDKIHGKGMRVANLLPKVPHRPDKVRCTVCERVVEMWVE